MDLAPQTHKFAAVKASASVNLVAMAQSLLFLWLG
jgi:hypothetical protein